MQKTIVNGLKKSALLACALLAVQAITACSPKVGSPEWCAAIKEKAAGDISANEAKEFAKNCMFK